MANLFFFIVCLIATGCHGNQFDPHVYPRTGPFFEGWYLRLVDDELAVSVGFLFGCVLPSSQSVKMHFFTELQNSSGVTISQPAAPTAMKLSHLINSETSTQDQTPLVLATVLLQDKKISPKLRSVNGFFNFEDYSVTAKGKPVVSNPDDMSPPNFAVEFRTNGSYSVVGDQMQVDVTVGNVDLFVRGSNPVAWGPGGEGPEGWLEYLPLPLHWFVYSLRSHVLEYSLVDRSSGLNITGRNARMHMEKNWGESFPPGWIWAQGVTKSNISLALSGGIVDFDILNVTAFLVGYRNPVKGIVFNFTPANSIFSFKHSGCDGFAHLNVTSPEHQLVLKIFSPMSSFSDCLMGPEKDGFRPVCVESYSGVAILNAFERKGFHYQPVDNVEIQNAALEFGGLYVCKGMCP